MRKGIKIIVCVFAIVSVLIASYNAIPNVRFARNFNVSVKLGTRFSKIGRNYRGDFVALLTLNEEEYADLLWKLETAGYYKCDDLNTSLAGFPSDAPISMKNVTAYYQTELGIFPGFHPSASVFVYITAPVDGDRHVFFVRW